jgi:hypothetical protein
MKDDPVIQRIREARHRISEKCGHDPTALVNYYMEMQKQYESRLLKPPVKEKTTELTKA